MRRHRHRSRGTVAVGTQKGSAWIMWVVKGGFLEEVMSGRSWLKELGDKHFWFICCSALFVYIHVMDGYSYYISFYYPVEVLQFLFLYPVRSLSSKSLRKKSALCQPSPSCFRGQSLKQQWPQLHKTCPWNPCASPPGEGRPGWVMARQGLKRTAPQTPGPGLVCTLCCLSVRETCRTIGVGGGMWPRWRGCWQMPL